MGNLTLVFVAIAAVVVIGCSAVLAIHRDYRSGVFGTTGLGVLAVGALARIEGIYSHFERVWAGVANEPIVSPTAVLVWYGIALFLVHLTVKFALRLRCKGKAGWYCA